MTSQELFLRVLDFQETRQNLNWDFGYWGGAITRWKQAGLPADIEFRGAGRDYTYGEFINGPVLPYPMASFDPNVLFASGLARLFNLDDQAYPPDISFHNHSYFRKELTRVVRPGLP